MQAVNINLDILRVVGYRQWCNKLWNVIRFAMTNLGSNFVPSATIRPASLPLSCQWILSVLNKAIDKTVKGLENYEFSESTTALHSWWLYELCDVFIEVIKPTMFGDDEVAKKATRDTLWVCLDTGLRLLHPFMPYLTEELWQRLPQREGEAQAKSSIVVAEYPAVNHVSLLSGLLCICAAYEVNISIDNRKVVVFEKWAEKWAIVLFITFH